MIAAVWLKILLGSEIFTSRDWPQVCTELHDLPQEWFTPSVMCLTNCTFLGWAHYLTLVLKDNDLHQALESRFPGVNHSYSPQSVLCWPHMLGHFPAWFLASDTVLAHVKCKWVIYMLICCVKTLGLDTLDNAGLWGQDGQAYVANIIGWPTVYIWY